LGEMSCMTEIPTCVFRRELERTQLPLLQCLCNDIIFNLHAVIKANCTPAKRKQSKGKPKDFKILPGRGIKHVGSGQRTNPLSRQGAAAQLAYCV
jgi:hypothetical protein